MKKQYLPLKDKYIMYGAEFSLYSGKVRSYLRKKGIPYIEHLSDIKTYKEFIVPRTGVRFIPVVQTPENRVIQDTTNIIDTLEKKFPENPVYPKTPKQKLASLLLEVYGDEWLLIPAMHYRWNFPEINLPFIYEEFGKTLLPKFPLFIQKFIGKKIGKKFKGFVPLLGITEKTISSIENSYMQFLRDLNAHFKTNKYLFGSVPSIGDFGLIAPLYAHLYRDPYPRIIMQKIAPKVVLWVERMMSNEKAKGSFLVDDHVPQSLDLILKRMATEHVPVLLDTAKILETWHGKNIHDDLPRMLGKHKFSIGGVYEERSVIPYSLWMWQRPYDYYQSLNDELKLKLNPWLEEMGFLEALNTVIPTRLKKFENHLLIEENN